MDKTPGLRERKKQATRRALVSSATRLFEEKGYARTTVAEIAEGAEVSTTTLFNYFTGKDDILFEGDRHRLETALRVISERGDDEEPLGLLARLQSEVLLAFSPEDAPAAVPDAVRARLLMKVPELQAKALQLIQEAQLQLGRSLHEAYPDRFDEVTAAGVFGALMGAAQTTRMTVLQQGGSPEEVMAAMRRGVDIALRGVLSIAGPEAGDPSG